MPQFDFFFWFSVGFTTILVFQFFYYFLIYFILAPFSSIQKTLVKIYSIKNTTQEFDFLSCVVFCFPTPQLSNCEFAGTLIKK